MSPRRATICTSLWLCERCVLWFETGNASASSGDGDPTDPARQQSSRNHIRRVKVRIADLGGGQVLVLEPTRQLVPALPVLLV